MRTAIDTTAGAGDTLKVGGDKLNAMTAELFDKADTAWGGRKPRIATLGESHATYQGMVPAILYSLWRYYPADVNFDYSSAQDQSAFDPSRGDIFAIGGTTTSQMVSDQLPKMLAAIAAGRTYDLVYIVAGFNNQIGDPAGEQAAFNDVTNTATQIRAAGVRLVVLCTLFPNNTGTPDPRSSQESYNNRLRQFANANSGMALMDITRVMVDPASATIKYRGTDNTYGGYSTDAVHASGTARRAIAKEIAPFHQFIAKRRVPRRGIVPNQFDPVSYPAADVTGPAGMMGSGGQGGLYGFDFSSSVAGYETPCCMQVTTQYGITATPSLSTGADGFRRQRLTVSSGGGGLVRFGFFTNAVSNMTNGVAGRGYDFEAVVELNAVNGLADILVQPLGNSTGAVPPIGTGNADLADIWPDGTTETLFVYSTTPVYPGAGYNNPAPSLTFLFGNRAVVGSIDISRFSLARCVG